MRTQRAEQPAPSADQGTAGSRGTGGSLDRLLPVRAGLAAAAVFVLGMFVGALTVGSLGGDPVVVQSPGDPQDGGAATGPTVPAGDAAAQFVVNGACLGAVNAAQDTALLVDDVALGAAELDAAALDETVRRLMPLQTRLRSGLEACEAAVQVSGGSSGGGASTSPSAVPSSSAPAGPSGD